MSCTVLGSEDTALKKTDKVYIFMEIIFQWRETDKKQESKCICQMISDSTKVLSLKKKKRAMWHEETEIIGMG